MKDLHQAANEYVDGGKNIPLNITTENRCKVVNLIFESFIAGAQRQAERMYTKTDMFIFAGYLQGAKELDPNVDLEEVFEEWRKAFKTKV